MNLHVALLWHGDREARDKATLAESRFAATAEALRAVGIDVEAAVYNDDFAGEVEEQLSKVDGVLVWVNPIEQGRDRTKLDSMLRAVAARGVRVSAHPDTILKMGTKQVLIDTREMSWGSDVHAYRTVDELREQLPERLAGGPRVLKQYRGQSGVGVWKVSWHRPDPMSVMVRPALRGSVEESMKWDALLDLLRPYFAGDGRIIDQAYQDRLTDGMVRCYMVRDQVAGFGHQEINALFPAPYGTPAEEAPQPGPRLYYPPTLPQFQDIKFRIEQEWLGGLCGTLDLDRSQLPLLWDADLLYGAKTAEGEDTYVLCEINVSSVYPFPEAALEPLARATKEWLVRG